MLYTVCSQYASETTNLMFFPVSSDIVMENLCTGNCMINKKTEN
jgi:hypothetical protein